MTQATEDRDTLLLAIRCVSLGISSKTVFNNIGLLTNLFVRATKSPVAKNEKRVIKLSQSDPFPTAGRPPTLNFGLLFTSEVFEDCPDIAPSLLAKVRRNNGMDSKLRLSVYYSSNLTGGKEVLLSATTFSERELMRAVSSTGVLTFLDMTTLPVTAPPRDVNPLRQRYIFYNEQDLLTPYLDAEEQTWEPKFSGLVPLLFLTNFVQALERSVIAWQRRYELERMRQGRFFSDAEAHQFGWHKLSVTIRAARFGASRQMVERKRYARTSSNNVVPGLPTFYLTHFPFGVDYFVEAPAPVGDESFAAKSARRSSKKPSSASKPVKGKGVQVKKTDEQAPSSFVQVFVEDRAQTFLQPLGRTNTEYFNYFPVYGSNLNATHARKPNSAAVPADDTVTLVPEEDEFTFCTYEAASRDFVPRRWRFSTPHTSVDNLPAGPLPFSSGMGSSGDRSPPNSVDVRVSTGLSSASPASHSSTSGTTGGSNGTTTPSGVASAGGGNAPSGSGPEDLAAYDPDDDTFVFTAVSGHQNTFCKYVSNCQRTSLRLDLCLESGTGTSVVRRIGHCSVILSDGMKKTTWVPVWIDGGDDSGVDIAEILLEVDISSPPSGLAAGAATSVPGAKERAPDKMTEIFMYERRVNGLLADSDSPPDDNLALSDHRRVLADCYEWLWTLGYTGHDPLLDEEVATSAAPAAITAPSIVGASMAGNGGGGGIGGSGMRDRAESDEMAVSVEVIERSLSADDVHEIVQSPGKIVSRRGSRIKRINRSAQPDSDDEDEVVSAGEGPTSRHELNALRWVDYETSQALVVEEPMYDASLPVHPSQSRHRMNTAGTTTDAGSMDQTRESEELSLPGDDRPVGESLQALLEGRLRDLTMTAPTPPRAHAKRVSIADGPSGGKAAGGAAGSVATTTSTPATTTAGAGGDDAGISPSPAAVRSRTDFVYPLSWIMKHIEELQQVIAEVRILLPSMRKRVENEESFRPSPLKKEAEVQALPINLHYQLLGVRKHVVVTDPDIGLTRSTGSTGSHGLPHVEVLHSVSAGALSPHMLGHKKGGLLFQEASLAANKNAVTCARDIFKNKVRRSGDRGISPYNADGAYTQLQALGKEVLHFEATCVAIGRRRMYALSQAISVAVSALLLKLNLVVAGKVPTAMAQRWLDHGFLIVFEGLLSVTGHERSMLEDTVSAISALRAFQVRILAQESPKSMGRASMQVGTKAQESVEMDFQGREVTIFMAPSALTRLPDSYQSAALGDGAVLKLVTMLFTQGIDIQQTMVTTFGDSGGGKRVMKSADLQHYVNSSGFDMLNLYCFRCQPIDSPINLVDATTGPVHPSASSAAGPSPSLPLPPPPPTTPSTPAPPPSPSPAAQARSTSAGGFDERTASSSGSASSLPATAPPASSQSREPLETIHPMAQCLYEILRSASLTAKNVDLLLEVERLCVMLGGVRVTFCKSGKDRTGMAVTLEQSRQLGERFGCGMSFERLLRDANLMRVYGTRLQVCSKNIGKPVYSINLLQAQFLPPAFRPPAAVCEDIMKKDNS